MSYNEEDIVKHWGLRSGVSGEWVTDGDGIIFAVMCPRVAEAQLDILKASYPEWVEEEEFEVTEIK